MSAAVRKLTEQAEAVGKAAEAILAVREKLEGFRALTKLDPQKVFGHTVREHQQSVETFDTILRAMCFNGRGIEAIASDAGFGREAVEMIRSAHLRLRVVRTLAAVLTGDTKALDNEVPEVRSEVERALAERKAASAVGWTREERDAFEGDARPLSLAFEARLNGS